MKHRPLRVFVEILVRLILQIVIIAAALTLFLLNSEPIMGMILIYPFFFGPPAILLTLAVLVPMEIWLNRRGIGASAYVVIPILAWLVPWLWAPFAPNFKNYVSGASGLSQLAFFWGLIWMFTRMIYRSVVRLVRRLRT